MAAYLPRVTPKMTRVLFCGNEFTWSFQFTKEALARHADIEVSLNADLSSIPLQLYSSLLCCCRCSDVNAQRCQTESKMCRWPSLSWRALMMQQWSVPQPSSLSCSTAWEWRASTWLP